jgi:NAD(P)-dependent dehydrogenase (short-subunit alcohol dehydrogenase family)
MMTPASPPSLPVVLVTGASTGIGRAIATHLAGAGYRVFGTSRQPSRAIPSAFPMLALDVRDDDSVQRCVAEVVATAGQIDALVNNAGYALVGAIEETAVDEVRAQMETNCFGALRMIHAVLPAMRRRRAGRIINISSVSGVLPPPFLGGYAASKHALEALSESLAFEVRGHGVAISLIELDSMRTGIAFSQPARREPAYDGPRGRMLARLVRGSQESGDDPHIVARCVRDALESAAPQLRYALGEHTVHIIEARRRLPEPDFIALATRQLDLWDHPAR